jgi:23S rRNA U2552 (ribose-2'-O)-methylase RlmE/FtsJ
MVKKIVMNLDNNDNIPKNISYDELHTTNLRLMDMITQYKNKITPYYVNKSWDKYKKVSNEYELIFTTPYAKSNVAQYNPVSRSFFKMWEILNDFGDKIITSNTNIGIKCLFLAEGPGGFLEAVMKYRSNKSDHYYGLTLKPEHKSIPEWKLKKFDMSQITTLYGEDDTGNLYNLQNTHHVANLLGKNTMDLVTADGGFDFSSDFNNQEDLSSKLIKCETYCAFYMLKDNGTYILKIYDMFNKITLQILAILQNTFKDIYIVKPLTSRPANSEKYLVCCGYKKDIGETMIDILGKNLKDGNDENLNININLQTLYNIVLYNTYYTSRQIFYIQKTIDYINIFDKLHSTLKFTKYDKLIEKNKKKCRNWCTKYKMSCIE